MSPGRQKLAPRSKTANKRRMGALQVFTVGYEGRDLAEFVAVLKAAGVDRVIDVRELPLSRRKGFSKTALSNALSDVGIGYVHLRSAGNPYRDQRADVARCLKLYAGHLQRSPEIVDEVLAAARGHRAALLCVERDACNCHRSVLAAQLEESATPVLIQNL